MWRICTSHKHMNLYREIYIIPEIRKGRLKWLKHVERMSEERTVKNGGWEYPGRKNVCWKAKKRIVRRR